MSTKDNKQSNKSTKPEKKAYKKPKVKIIKIDKAIVHATDQCGGCGY